MGITKHLSLLACKSDSPPGSQSTRRPPMGHGRSIRIGSRILRERSRIPRGIQQKTKNRLNQNIYVKENLSGANNRLPPDANWAAARSKEEGTNETLVIVDNRRPRPQEIIPDLTTVKIAVEKKFRILILLSLFFFVFPPVSLLFQVTVRSPRVGRRFWHRVGPL